MITNDNIIALATPSGAGAIAVIRISGKDAIALANPFFTSIRGKDLRKQKSHTIHLGHITENDFLQDPIPIQVKMLLRYPVMVRPIFNNR